MSYRLYTQPLTLKTESKPVDGELLVDIESGHILVYEEVSNSINSATKDLHGEMSLDKYLIQLINEEANAIFARMDKLLPKYPELKTSIDGLTSLIVGLQSRLNAIGSGMENQLIYAKENSTRLMDLYGQLGNLLQTLFREDYLIAELARVNKEFQYMIDLPTGIKAQLTTDVNAATAYKNTIKTLIDTKVSKTEYNTWVTGYVNRVNALSSGVKFRYTGG